MVTEASVCKQDTCQAAYSKHAGRFVTASFTWAVESIRPAEIKLIPMPWFVRHMRATAPKGSKRKRSHVGIKRGKWRHTAGAVPIRCLGQARGEDLGAFEHEGSRRCGCVALGECGRGQPQGLPALASPTANIRTWAIVRVRVVFVCV